MLVFALMLLAQSGSAGGPAAKLDQEDPAAKKVCRREDSTGSFLSKRVCHTRTEWASIDAAKRKAAEDALITRGPTRIQSY